MNFVRGAKVLCMYSLRNFSFTTAQVEIFKSFI